MPKLAAWVKPQFANENKRKANWMSSCTGELKIIMQIKINGLKKKTNT